jgi:hypothetical protein
VEEELDIHLHTALGITDDRYKEILEELVPALNEEAIAKDHSGIRHDKALAVIKRICKTPDEMLVISYLSGMQMGKAESQRIVIVGGR